MCKKNLSKTVLENSSKWEIKHQHNVSFKYFGTLNVHEVEFGERLMVAQRTNWKQMSFDAFKFEKYSIRAEREI